MPPDTASPEVKHSSPIPLASLLTLLVVVIVGVYIAFSGGFFAPVTGTVSVLVRDIELGTRSVGDLNLATGHVSPRTDIDPNEVSVDSSKIFSLSNGSYIALAPSGIVLRNDDQKSEQLLVATPVAPTISTPLAVWGDGQKVAWANPSDHSLQIFERTARGAYVPVYLNSAITANSLTFSPDGTVLFVATLGKDLTNFYAITIMSNSVSPARSLKGLASILPSL